MPYTRLSAAEQAEVWDRWERGDAMNVIARGIGRSQGAVHEMIKKTGGVRPLSPTVWSERRLSLTDREEISRGLAAGRSLRAIAESMARAPSTISREVAANGGRRRYRACDAETSARLRARRPKTSKLARGTRLCRVVEAKLTKKWSPQQIARWLPLEYPDDPEMRVSHETIYMSLFVQGRGALRKELATCLRQGRAFRRSGGKRLQSGRGKIRDMVLISERPAEIEDRAVPGHWEGDLIMGKGQTSIATLVERQTRFVMLVRLPEGHTAEHVRRQLSKKIVKLPVELRRSLTWDQGHELAQHLRFTVDTGVQVYFCDPKSPWQRGSNENTNGLLRPWSGVPVETKAPHVGCPPGSSPSDHDHWHCSCCNNTFVEDYQGESVRLLAEDESPEI